jgi:hypothetical protein
VHYIKSRRNTIVDENCGLKQEDWKEEEGRRRRRGSRRY